MRWIALAMALAATPAEAHCYSRWYYPWPQHCGVHSTHQKASEATRASSDAPKEPDIPLPSLASADLDGGEADEPTRALILLRAALEASYAR
jgi:hypothetical protein